MSDRTCLIDGCEKQRRARGWCSRHYNRWKHAGDPIPVYAATHCGWCKVELPADRRTDVKYCSTACRVGKHQFRNPPKRKPLKPILIKSCCICGAEFSTKHSRRSTCSTRCYKKTAPPPTRKCSIANCGKPHRAKGMCSMHWKRAARASGSILPDPWSDRRRANYHKRRALKARVPFDSIVPSEVFERDEWVCGICAESVDASLTHPDPMSASLDHVIPLSKGGGHVLENVQLAHLTCNVRKGTQVSDFHTTQSA